MRARSRHASSEQKRTDAELLELVARAHCEALGQLYLRHADAMRITACRITRDESEAEDLLHDIFLEIWRTAVDYEPARGSVRTWLLVRTRSRSLDRRRRLSRQSAVESLASSEGDAHSSVDQFTLQNAVTRLPDPLRHLLVLGYYAGMSSAEIARALEIPLGTVKSRVARALTALRAALAED